MADPVHKDRIFLKKHPYQQRNGLQNGIKNIQAAVYNGARTVIKFQPSEGHPY